MKNAETVQPNYYAIHHHQYGTSVYLIHSDHRPAEFEIVEACGMDFEPDKDEWIDLDAISPGDTVKVIPSVKGHGTDCASRLHTAAECTCGKADQEAGE